MPARIPPHARGIVRDAAIKATFADGVLEVSVPMAVAAAPVVKKVPIDGPQLAAKSAA